MATKNGKIITVSADKIDEVKIDHSVKTPLNDYDFLDNPIIVLEAYETIESLLFGKKPNKLSRKNKLKSLALMDTLQRLYEQGVLDQRNIVKI